MGSLLKHRRPSVGLHWCKARELAVEVAAAYSGDGLYICELEISI